MTGSQCSLGLLIWTWIKWKDCLRYFFHISTQLPFPVKKAFSTLYIWSLFKKLKLILTLWCMNWFFSGECHKNDTFSESKFKVLLKNALHTPEYSNMCKYVILKKQHSKCLNNENAMVLEEFKIESDNDSSTDISMSTHHPNYPLLILTTMPFFLTFQIPM